MKRQFLLTVATVLLLFSACALAGTIDPGGIIRSGSEYENYAVIGPGFTITFHGDPVPFPFNPYDENLVSNGFCPTGDGTLGDMSVEGPDCQFINESGHTINSISQFFAANGEALSPFSCFNGITNQECSTGPDHNALLFAGLGIPTADEEGWIEDYYGGDPEFNILYFNFDPTTLAAINSMTIPEPASAGLMLSGLLGLGLAARRRKAAK